MKIISYLYSVPVYDVPNSSAKGQWSDQIGYVHQIIKGNTAADWMKVNRKRCDFSLDLKVMTEHQQSEGVMKFWPSDKFQY